MPSHIHFITYSENGEISGILRDMKAFTAKKLMQAIEENPQESRKEWMMSKFEYYGNNSAQKQNNQFWKHDNHPFFLYTPYAYKIALFPNQQLNRYNVLMPYFIFLNKLVFYW